MSKGMFSVTRTRIHYLWSVWVVLLTVSACEPPPSTGFSGGKGGLDTTMPFECSGATLAAFSEACNGLDDDCDGQVDEGLSECSGLSDDLPFRLCSTACCVDDEACESGEVCQRIGEQGRCEPECQDGEFRLCSFGCEPKFQECIGGYWAVCSSQRPDVERCNEQDDDCDGQIDENQVCLLDLGVTEELDRSVNLDMAPPDAGLPLDQRVVDAVVDAEIPVDAALPPEPECVRHNQCPQFNLCLGGSCRSGLPGTFNIVIQSAKVSDLGNLDLYAELKRGELVLGTTERAESGDDTPNWGHRVRVDLNIQQILEVCVSDHDGFLNGDDLAGCASFSTETVIEVIRSFRGTRVSPNWASFKPTVMSGCCLDEVFLHVDRL